MLLYVSGDFQAVFGHQFGVGHNFFSFAVGDDSALVEQDRPVGECGGKTHIAGGYDKRLRQRAEKL